MNRLIFTAIVSLLTLHGNVQAGDGCSFLPPTFPSPYREVLQQTFNVLFFGACSRHDACYRSCSGSSTRGYFGQKEYCDGVFFGELSAWCTAVGATQEFTDAGLDFEEWFPLCETAAGTVLSVIQGPAGLSAYANDQCLLCGNGCPAPSPPPIPGCPPEDRLYCQEIQWRWDRATCSCNPPESPLVLRLGGVFRFTDAENGVDFDIDGDGFANRVGWTGSSHLGFLTLDRNGNGEVDNGLELFGNLTPQPPSGSPNGFFALAVFDQPGQGGNGDGQITAADPVFQSLRVWIDRNHDGRSDFDELETLQQLAVRAIDLDFRESRRRDRYGNEFRYRSRVYFDDGTWEPIVDVFLVTLW